jgi:transcriptional regulator with XRE-family HTH domain
MTKSHCPLDVHVGRRLSLRRIENGVTREQLGAVLAVSVEQIEKFEEGSETLGVARLYDASLFLDVPPIYFFEDFDDKQVASRADRRPYTLAQVADRNFVRLVAAYVQVEDPIKRTSVVELVEAFARRA